METTTRLHRPQSSGQTRPPKGSESIYFTWYGSKCTSPWDTVQMLLSVSSIWHKEKTWQPLWSMFESRTSSQTESAHVLLYFTPLVSPLLWGVTSAFPSERTEWHRSFVLESPHLIHGRLTPESEAGTKPFRIPDSLICWFIRHWISSRLYA